MQVKLFIIVKNELKNIRLHHDLVIQTAQDNGVDYLYVDGNSTDGTIDFFEKNSIKFVQQNGLGRGGAIRTALSIDCDYYIIFSPDGNENILDLPKFISLFSSGADLVIASRMMEGAHNEEDENLIKPRKWANNVFNLLANIAFNKSGRYVTDSINGYRGISKNLLSKISLTSVDYTIEYQMTIRAMKASLDILEFPTFEGERVFGTTGAPSIKTGIAFVRKFLAELLLKHEY
jgi:glycosyltransferase involved in cell wall biosynthesis